VNDLRSILLDSEPEPTMNMWCQSRWLLGSNKTPETAIHDVDHLDLLTKARDQIAQGTQTKGTENKGTENKGTENKSNQ
jgi:hypothetical protein